jgi:hypothetical protein
MTLEDSQLNSRIADHPYARMRVSRCEITVARTKFQVSSQGSTRIYGVLEALGLYR